MIVSEEKRPSKSQERNTAIIITFIFFVFMGAGAGIGSWLSGVFHTWWLTLFGMFGGFALSFVMAYKVGKYFGVDVFSDFYPAGRY